MARCNSRARLLLTHLVHTTMNQIAHIQQQSASKLAWYRQALVQFLFGAALLYALDTLLYAEDNAQIIRTDDAALLNYLQVSQKSFDPVLAQAKFTALSIEERAALKQRFVESEILYREALKLGLGEYDDVMRTRMIQKMDYVLFGLPNPQKAAPEPELRAWYQAHIEDYRVGPTIAFTHIFFSTQHRPRTQALAQAQQTLAMLQQQGYTAASAQGLGDRFYFHLDYVDKSPELVASHFDQTFQETVFALLPQRWSGPIESKHGVHLVYVSRQQASYLPRFEVARPAVKLSYTRAQRREARQRAIANLATAYQVIE